MDRSSRCPLDVSSIRQFFEQTSGVYMVRQKDGKFGRLNGPSDILYIGQSDKDLKNRAIAGHSKRHG